MMSSHKLKNELARKGFLAKLSFSCHEVLIRLFSLSHRKREISEQKTKSEPKEKRQRIENPQKVTKSELKRELTRLGVPLPPKEESKQFYVDLYLAQFE